jgi:hypothetical protein
MADNVLQFPDLIPAPTPGRCDLRSFLDHIVWIAVEKHDQEDALAALAAFERKAQAEGWPQHLIGREARRIRRMIEAAEIDRARRIAFVLHSAGQSMDEYLEGLRARALSTR